MRTERRQISYRVHSYRSVCEDRRELLARQRGVGSGTDGRTKGLFIFLGSLPSQRLTSV